MTIPYPFHMCDHLVDRREALGTPSEAALRVWSAQMSRKYPVGWWREMHSRKHQAINACLSKVPGRREHP